MSKHPQWYPVAVAAGTPVLYGPYVVDYTDIATDGSTKVLWTPQVGDQLLAWWTDPATAITFDNPAHFANGEINYGPADLSASIVAPNPSWVQHPFTSASPMQVRYTAAGDGDLTAGHQEIYALIAQAVAP